MDKWTGERGLLQADEKRKIRYKYTEKQKKPIYNLETLC